MASQLCVRLRILICIITDLEYYDNNIIEKNRYIKSMRKVVFRIMGENNLLNYRYNYRSPARRVVESIVSVQKTNDVWEMDIKYVYIHGENRTAYLFAIIDCYNREVVGKHIGYHCSSQKVKMAIDFAFLDRGIMQIKNVRIRSDNGTQFVSRMVELFLSSSHMRGYILQHRKRMHILSHSIPFWRRKL